MRRVACLEKTTRPTRPSSGFPDVYRAGREDGPFPSHLVASSSEVFAPILTESEENPAEGAPSCPDQLKKAMAVAQSTGSCIYWTMSRIRTSR